MLLWGLIVFMIAFFIALGFAVQKKETTTSSSIHSDREIRFVYKDLNLDCDLNREELKYSCNVAASEGQNVTLTIESPGNEYTNGRQNTVVVNTDGNSTYTI